jgi:hypothetical protein
LGSDWVAHNQELLEKNKITHVVNSAADYSMDYFPEKIKYLHFFLKDTSNESIECCFYDCIQFIENALNEGGKVLIHCMQGISRSASLCIAYIIFKKAKTFQEALEEVQKCRPVANPNIMFSAQLLWWHMRLYKEYTALPVIPRVFVIGSHQVEDPEYIVARLLMENVFDRNGEKGIDPRGMYVIQTQNLVYVWIGSQICKSNLERYTDKCNKHISLLQKYEKASSTVITVKEGEEPKEFWEQWNNAPVEMRYKQISTMDSWFVDIDKAKLEKIESVKHKELEEGSGGDISEKPFFFAYPNLDNGVSRFDMDELTDSTMVICCLKGANQCYIWKKKEEVFDEVYILSRRL